MDSSQHTKQECIEEARASLRYAESTTAYMNDCTAKGYLAAAGRAREELHEFLNEAARYRLLAMGRSEAAKSIP